MNPPLSTPGMIMGTAGYMSPEQAAGSAVIDARADIFSFGCILYEAATKQQPFAGKSLIDSLHKIIHDQPPPIKDFNAEISPDLQRIVRRCLAKNAEDRYQTIKDVAIELKELRREMEDSGGDDSFGSPKTTADTRAHQISERANTVTNRVNASSAKLVARTTSSAEYLVGEAKKHKIGAGIAAALLVTLAASIGYGIYNLIAAKQRRFFLSISDGEIYAADDSRQSVGRRHLARRQICRIHRGRRRAAEPLDQTGRHAEQRPDRRRPPPLYIPV